MKNILSNIRDNHESIFKVFLFLVTLLIIVYFFPRQINFKYEYSKGKPWLEETIITPFDFPILKSEEELKIEIEEVKNENKPVFILKQDVFENAGVKFIQDFEEKWANDKKINKDKRFTFFNLFKKENDKNTTAKYTLANFGLSVLEHLYTEGIVQLSDELQWKEEGFRVLLKKENLAEIKNLENFFTINSAVDYINSMG